MSKEYPKYFVYNRKIVILFLLVLFCFSSIAVLFQVPSVSANGESWLTGWNYRKSHVINAATGAGTNYQVQVTALFNSSSNSDFINNGMTEPFFSLTNSPTSMYYNDRTYVVYQGDAHELNPYITYYDHTTGIWATPVKIANSPLTDDSHGVPALMIDNSGYIHVAYGSHDSAIKYAKSANPEDISSWTAMTDLPSGTYPAWIKDASGYLYLFYREGSSPWSQLYMVKSTNGGTSWSAPASLIDVLHNAADWMYHGLIENDLANGKIHISWTELDNAASRLNIYEAYYKISDGHMYNESGTDLGTQISWAEMQASAKVVDTGASLTNVPAMHLDSSGKPYIIYNLQNSSSFDARFTYWTGSAWTTPVTITANGQQFNWEDFIVTSSTNIEAYLTVSTGTRGGNIEKWTWNGSTWTKVLTLLSSTYGNLNNPSIPLNFQAPIKVLIPNVDPVTGGNEDFTTIRLIYAFDGTNFVPRPFGNNVNLEGHSRTDFGDVRFTDNDGNTQLAYYIQTLNTGVNATFWVKVNDSLESAGQSIYIYYGNSTSTTTSNGFNTFLLFDDFNDNSFNATTWTATGTGTVVETGGKAVITSLSGATERLISTATFGVNTQMLASSTMSISSSEQQGTIGYSESTGYNRTWIAGYNNAGYPYFYCNSVKEGTGTTTNSASSADSNSHIFGVKRTSTANVFNIDASTVTASTNIPTASIPLMAQAYSTAVENIDWIAAAKYVSPEPTNQQWSLEEAPPSPRVMLGIYNYPDQSADWINSWSTNVSKGIAWFAIGSNIEDGFWQIPSVTPMVTNNTVKGIMFTLMTGSAADAWDYSTNGDYTKAVANGTYDASITSWANTCRDSGIPIILRIDQEMNSDYAGYGVNATTFKAAWIRIHDIFQTRNATNVKFFWCPNYSERSDGTTFADFYPGNAYVDYVGTDMYTTTVASSGWWNAARQIRNAGFSNVYDTYTTKPFIIGEWGCSNAFSDSENKQWLSEMFAAIATDTRVVGMIHWHGGQDGWNVDDYPLTYAAYQTNLASTLYTSNLVDWAGYPGTEPVDSPTSTPSPNSTPLSVITNIFGTSLAAIGMFMVVPIISVSALIISVVMMVRSGEDIDPKLITAGIVLVIVVNIIAVIGILILNGVNTAMPATHFLLWFASVL